MGLFGGENKGGAEGAVDTILGERAKFKGELESTGPISVHGEFEGKLQSSGEVIIGQTGRVTGEIKGALVTVAGKVDGNIIATEILEIAKSGKVHGDLTGGKIVIEEGALYRGKVSVSEAEPQQPVL